MSYVIPPPSHKCNIHTFELLFTSYYFLRGFLKDSLTSFDLSQWSYDFLAAAVEIGDAIIVAALFLELLSGTTPKKSTVCKL
jgi:hypothetical protein